MDEGALLNFSNLSLEESLSRSGNVLLGDVLAAR
jgi:hypothetical protein